MRLTVISTYYNDEEYLRQLETTWKLAPNRAQWLIVDDGSQVKPAEPVIRSLDPVVQSKIRLFRIDEDFGFNSHGARNLGMLMAKTNWTLLIDMDRMYGAGLFQYLNKRKLDPLLFYSFMHPHSTTGYWKGLMANTFLIQRETFWATGGYDEELRGMHMGDEYFHKQLLITSQQALLDYRFGVLRGAWTWKERDGVTQSSYDEDTRIMVHPKRDLYKPLQAMVIDRINKRQFHLKPTINFPWREIRL